MEGLADIWNFKLLIWSKMIHTKGNNNISI